MTQTIVHNEEDIEIDPPPPVWPLIGQLRRRGRSKLSPLPTTPLPPRVAASETVEEENQLIDKEVEQGFRSSTVWRHGNWNSMTRRTSSTSIGEPDSRNQADPWWISVEAQETSVNRVQADVSGKEAMRIEHSDRR